MSNKAIKTLVLSRAYQELSHKLCANKIGNSVVTLLADDSTILQSMTDMHCKLQMQNICHNAMSTFLGSMCLQARATALQNMGYSNSMIQAVPWPSVPPTDKPNTSCKAHTLQEHGHTFEDTSIGAPA